MGSHAGHVLLNLTLPRARVGKRGDDETVLKLATKVEPQLDAASKPSRPRPHTYQRGRRAMPVGGGEVAVLRRNGTQRSGMEAGGAYAMEAAARTRPSRRRRCRPRRRTLRHGQPSNRRSCRRRPAEAATIVSLRTQLTQLLYESRDGIIGVYNTKAAGCSAYANEAHDHRVQARHHHPEGTT